MVGLERARATRQVSNRRRGFDHPPEQDLVDPATKANFSVEFHDRNAVTKTPLQFGVGIDVYFFNSRKVFNIIGQDGLGVVAQVTVGT